MKKLILISFLAVLFTSCLKEKCTQCIERNTNTQSKFCGTEKEVRSYEDNLSNTNASGYYQWQCSRQ
jgi:hypothetical protein